MADILSLSSRSDSSFVSDPDILEEKSQGSSPRSTASSLPRHFESIVDNQKAVDSQGPSVTSLTFFESASQSSPLEEPDRASEELLRLSVLASECGRYDEAFELLFHSIRHCRTHFPTRLRSWYGYILHKYLKPKQACIFRLRRRLERAYRATALTGPAANLRDEEVSNFVKKDDEVGKLTLEQQRDAEAYVQLMEDQFLDLCQLLVDQLYHEIWPYQQRHDESCVFIEKLMGDILRYATEVAVLCRDVHKLGHGEEVSFIDNPPVDDELKVWEESAPRARPKTPMLRHSAKCLRGRHLFAADTITRLNSSVEVWYDRAWKQAEATLEPWNPVRVSLVLHRCIFLFGCCSKLYEAFEFGSAQYWKAVESIDEMFDEEFRDTGPVLMMLKELLEAWGAYRPEEAAERQEGTSLQHRLVLSRVMSNTPTLVLQRRKEAKASKPQGKVSATGAPMRVPSTADAAAAAAAAAATPSSPAQHSPAPSSSPPSKAKVPGV